MVVGGFKTRATTISRVRKLSPGASSLSSALICRDGHAFYKLVVSKWGVFKPAK